jgi:8-oxo-dGTP diphosphatase
MGVLTMQGLNVIWVFNPTADKVLFCKRHKPPYLGLYNLVGGKIEAGEDGFSAAYRELREETSITEIELVHLMDFTYFLADACRVEVYVGKLKQEIDVHGDEKELVWFDVTENFFDMSRFAGEGNIGHIYEMIKMNRLDGR